MLFKETITVYSENSMKHTNTHNWENKELFIVKAGGTGL
jgi:hypothetical protein